MRAVMKLGAAGEALIKSYESLQLRAYKAVATEEFFTVGWGHYGPDVKPGSVITREQAQVLFDKDISKFVAAVNAALVAPATQNQFDAMVSLAFNIGAGNFSSSTLLKKFNAGDYAGAADEFPKWNRSGGRVLAGLVKRRAAERDLFIS